MTLVPYGSVVDTTSDPAWVPVTVTARLAEPVIGLDTNPMALDGPLSWCAAQAALAAGETLPPVRKDWMVDFALPVATWTATPSRSGVDPRLLAADGASVWGWACSQAMYTVDGYTAVHMRRRPATLEMSRYSRDRKHHAGLGVMKARDVVLPATVVTAIHWHALADPDALAEFLTHLTHVGRVTGHGNGRVHTVTVAPARDRDGWRNRPMPDPAGGEVGIRAPYYHFSRRMPCR